MPENETMQTMPDTEETPAVQTTAPTKHTRKPRVKDRTLEELDTVAPTKMTDSEKNSYINTCRSTISQLAAQNAALDKNCKSAYEQQRNAIDANARLIAKFNEDMAFVCSASNNLNKTIQMIGGGNK